MADLEARLRQAAGPSFLLMVLWGQPARQLPRPRVYTAGFEGCEYFALRARQTGSGA
jgi:hypothetical protein